MLTESLETLDGVGPKLSLLLSKCGIETISELLFDVPYRYQDRTRITAIRDLRPNDWAVVCGRIVKVETKIGKRPMLTCYLEDKTGRLKIRFFNFHRQLQQNLQDKPYFSAFGEVKFYADGLEMAHPEFQILKEDGIFSVEESLTPIYSSTQGLSQKKRRQLIQLALEKTQDTLKSLEWLSSDALNALNLMPIDKALNLVHAPPPDTNTALLEGFSHPALARLIFEELIAHQLSMLFAKQHAKQLRAPQFAPSTHYHQALKAQLPFSLTKAQIRVIDEIAADLQQPTPMNRLVQGDVGAGKTLVAMISALHVIEAGYQVALMAPTEILSEQHAANIERALAPLGIRVERLQGKMREKAKRDVLTQLSEGTIQMVIGTHALFQEQVQFNKLGLIIIDEQHRFGVMQRLLLQQKGKKEDAIPHQLLMTATPIPRTLAMAQYAHLDLSIIDELPPGRTPITTAVLPEAKRPLVISRLKEAIASGKQAYWVCTLIEESETLQCACAEETLARLVQELPEARIGLIHGRMRADEKDTVMSAFKQGELDILVATTVIEVGVDVPNASLIIIENAERLGLAQLHQLRGRVGRGALQSYCILMYQTPLSAIGRERLHVMRNNTDGFYIAEQDLLLRGSGEILGKKQTGYRQFKLAKIERDTLLLEQARASASSLIQTDIETAKHVCKRWLGHYEQYIQG